MSIAPIRYAIVGLGRAGWDLHVSQLRNRNDARIVAAADPLQDRLEQAATDFGCRTFSDIGGLLASRDLNMDVVVIATPSIAHGPDTIAALRAGKHVVVEKPMGMTLDECDLMIQTAARSNRRLFVHQNYRFFPEFTHLRDVVDSGILGRLFHIRLYITAFTRRNDWQTLRKNGGGLLNNICPHFIDQIVQLAGGRIVQAMGDLQQIVSPGDVEDHVKAFLRADNGCTADLEVSYAQNLAVQLPKWILCGSFGTLQSDGIQSTLRWFDPRHASPLQAIDGAACSRQYANGDKLPWQEKNVRAIGANVGTFYDNVSAVLRQNAPMHVTPQSVREVVRVISMIRESAESKSTAKEA